MLVIVTSKNEEYSILHIADNKSWFLLRNLEKEDTVKFIQMIKMS